MDAKDILRIIGYGNAKPTLTECEIAEKSYELGIIDSGIGDAYKKDSLACTCGNKIFTHRHSNWIECAKCNKIQILKA